MKKEVKECVSYIAEDGTRFESEKRCIEYEIELKRPKVYMVIVRYGGLRSGEKLIGICSTRQLAERLMDSEQSRWDTYNNKLFIEEAALIDN